ncbi:DUF5677 domain-containing protein [Pseudomonas marginalis]|uniref:DUF5677 domain-containing protein n=1 Tax=Pseudomonas marginalis TaxID=298 RepID=UPI0034D44334
MSKKKKKTHRPGKITTPLAGHKKIGKALVPPFMQLPGMSFSSWANDRLPDMLWACLVITVIPRKEAIEVFRDIASIGLKYRQDDELQQGAEPKQARGWTLRHVDLPNQPIELFNALVARVLRCHAGLQALRPLLLLDNLPGLQWWKAALDIDPVDDDWQTLGEAVLKTFDHQSQEATDVRWLSVLFKIGLGELLVFEGLRERVQELIEYPYRGEMRSVRPSIRSMEMAVTTLKPDQAPNLWPESFWAYMLEHTDCLPAPLESRGRASQDPQALVKAINDVREALLEHWYTSLSTSGLNPKHDGVFGFGFYALACLAEMGMGPMSSAITGRLLLRSLTECRISLAYLVRNGTDEMWKKFRSYGAGQAKLALLKHEEMSGQKPRFVTLETLEALANEDYFQEYVEIDLGHWCGKDLRRLAEESATKEDYDRYYGWASGFVHGQWGAMRDTNFTHCLNPLHRFHRIPLPFHRMLESTTDDALHLVNCILDDVNTIYPGLDARFVLADVPAGDEEENPEAPVAPA